MKAESDKLYHLVSVALTHKVSTWTWVDGYFIVNYDKSLLPRPPVAENNGLSC